MKLRSNLFFLLIYYFVFTGCQSVEKEPLVVKHSFETSPVLSLEESLQSMTVEQGFEVIPVAAEPLVSSPVTLTFDDKGRMWVVEMQGYMPDEEGAGEESPNGKIVILTDTNADGKADVRKVFLDSLVLPRSICLIENGILLVEPPRLWFIEINNNDVPGKRTLVDSAYTEGDNVEGQANGLYRAMDNWIYNTRSEKSYRKKGDKWLTRRAHLRGQWGISQDNFGRLFYNNNSQNLLGDFFLPGLGISNSNQQRVAGFSEKIVPDNRIYPSRPTPGVNRGYQEGILDTNQRLISFTAASGPVIYRGDMFNKEYQLNAFVGEPAANLIKRNIISEKGNMINGVQAYEGKEFLTSLDERFRPVFLCNGPDGALYVADMYRGIIQHKSLMTEYLKKQVKKRSLERPVDCGRIYKIILKGNRAKPVLFPQDPYKLLDLLQHQNGWVRDKAQQALVDGKFLQIGPDLRRLLKKTGSPITICHALWTLEGMDLLQPEDVLPLLENADWNVRMPALGVLSSVVDKGSYKIFAGILKRMIDRNDSLAAPYIAFQAGTIQAFDYNMANDLLFTILKKYPRDHFVAAAVISNLKNNENNFYKQMVAGYPDSNLEINKQLKKVIEDIEDRKNNNNNILLKAKYPRGARVFTTICQTCHKADGSGVPSLAPPLNRSEWVVGDKDKLISIVLYGLVGPIEVNGKLYKAPEISGDMPPLVNNKDIVDEDVAQLLSFIRNSWNNKAEPVSSRDVQKVRQRLAGRQQAFTADELNNDGRHN